MMDLKHNLRFQPNIYTGTNCRHSYNVMCMFFEKDASVSIQTANIGLSGHHLCLQSMFL